MSASVGMSHAGKKVGLAFDRRRQPAAAQSGVKQGARVARAARQEEDAEEKESFFKRNFGEIRIPSFKGLFTIRGRRDDDDAVIARREPQLGAYEEPEIDLPEP